MKHPPRLVFRMLTSVGLVLTGLYWLAFEFRWFAPSSLVQETLDLNHYGAAIPVAVLNTLWWIFFGASVVGGLAFLLFLPWSRGLLVAVLALETALMPFDGLYTSTGLYDFIGVLADLCLTVPLVLSFFPPCDGYFKKSPN